MIVSMLVSLPPETLRQLQDADDRAGGGGSRGERRAALILLVLAVLPAVVLALSVG